MSISFRETQPTASEFLNGTPATFSVSYNRKISDAITRGGPRMPRKTFFDLRSPHPGAMRLMARIFWPQQFIHKSYIVRRLMAIYDYQPADPWAVSAICSWYPTLQLQVALPALGIAAPCGGGEESFFCWCWDGFLPVGSQKFILREPPRTPAVEIVPERGGWEPRYAFLGIRMQQK
jgi:hypothetical protein